jgi:alkanesulfonate monooxygenase SsuD/methylene tetrahydromethanopterin reductase-like flavin-dependent oxidoreductase (luciferase family)
MLAKAAATLDRLSGGRFELGLGAGAFWDAIRAMGGPVREPKEALKALEEAIAVMRSWWSGNRGLRLSGDVYQLAGANPGPAPVHEIGIWLGVLKPKALALTGRLADGWVPSISYVPPAVAKESNALIDDAARDSGRDPSEIRRIYNLGGVFAPTSSAPFTDQSTEIVGPPAYWIDALSYLITEIGFDTFVLWSSPDERTLRTFIDEVAPAVRERVGR